MSQHFLGTDYYKVEGMSNVFIINFWQWLIARLFFFSKNFACIQTHMVLDFNKKFAYLSVCNLAHCAVT